jgi:hypothetical protein
VSWSSIRSSVSQKSAEFEFDRKKSKLRCVTPVTPSSPAYDVKKLFLLCSAVSLLFSGKVPYGSEHKPVAMSMELVVCPHLHPMLCSVLRVQEHRSRSSCTPWPDPAAFPRMKASKQAVLVDLPSVSRIDAAFGGSPLNNQLNGCHLQESFHLPTRKKKSQQKGQCNPWCH